MSVQRSKYYSGRPPVLQLSIMRGRSEQLEDASCIWRKGERAAGALLQYSSGALAARLVRPSRITGTSHALEQLENRLATTCAAHVPSLQDAIPLDTTANSVTPVYASLSFCRLPCHRHHCTIHSDPAALSSTSWTSTDPGRWTQAAHMLLPLHAQTAARHDAKGDWSYRCRLPQA